MSYDLRLWSIVPVPASALQKLMPHARVLDDGVELAGEGWLATIGHSTPVEVEDVPDYIAAASPGIKSLNDLVIQPISAPDDAKDAIKQALKALAEEFYGVVEDPQTGMLLLPSGTRRAQPTRQTESRLSTLGLNYWFTESPLRTRDGRGRLLDYLAENLPAALPRRYGLHEPPGEKWEVGGQTAFLDFLDRQAAGRQSVIYPSHPCVSFDFFPVDFGWRRGPRRVFKCGCLKIAFDFAALEDAAYRSILEKAWLDIARIVQPFATNVEVVDGWTYSRGHLWVDAQTGDSVCTTAWFGVPRRLGLAFGLAEICLPYWPRMRTNAAMSDGLAYVDAGNWRSRRSVSEIIGEAPSAIRERPGRGRTLERNGAVRHEPAPQGYPSVFFFPMPHRPWASLAAWAYRRFNG